MHVIKREPMTKAPRDALLAQFKAEKRPDAYLIE
jgi:hypothetical protein